jgi:hypothetical protein
MTNNGMANILRNFISILLCAGKTGAQEKRHAAGPPGCCCYPIWFLSLSFSSARLFSKLVKPGDRRLSPHSPRLPPSMTMRTKGWGNQLRNRTPSETVSKPAVTIRQADLESDLLESRVRIQF